MTSVRLTAILTDRLKAEEFRRNEEIKQLKQFNMNLVTKLNEFQSAIAVGQRVIGPFSNHLELVSINATQNLLNNGVDAKELALGPVPRLSDLNVRSISNS